MLYTSCHTLSTCNPKHHVETSENNFHTKRERTATCSASSVTSTEHCSSRAVTEKQEIEHTKTT